jgi:hypothetical protein
MRCVFVVCFCEAEPFIKERRFQRVSPKTNDPKPLTRFFKEETDEEAADSLPALIFRHVKVSQPADFAVIGVWIAIEPTHADNLVFTDSRDQALARSIEPVRSGSPIVYETLYETEAVADSFLVHSSESRIQAGYW